MAHMNLLPIIVSAILYFVIGWIWYSPKAFGKKWMELTQIKCEECKGGLAKCCLGAFVIGLIVSAVMSYFVGLSGATNMFEGAKIGFLAWLGFGAAILGEDPDG